ncbi:Alpha/Beta hydrolase protein [Aspergillus pseudoustus]|uniref:Alpha/Beta hydrolase protein n=1 Tax=Aspergillus pseudoustus TaxID=1810923 RepID=A0ABR4JIU7_9EURO
MTMGSESGPVHAPAWQQFINELGDPLLMPGTTVEALYGDSNANIQKLLAKYTFPPPDSSIQTEDITLKDGVWVRIYTPPDLTSTDLTIFIHGGGFIMGSVNHEDAAVRGICAATKKTVVSIGYRLAPKHKFPVALEDCLYATLWALDYFSASTSSAVLMGGSAGANLAFGVALKLIDAGMSEKFKGVLALVPMVVHPAAVPADKLHKFTSYEENAVATVNTLAAMTCFLDSYEPPVDDAYFSVLLHPRIRELKKVYIVECGADTLRDDARLMKDALEDMNVPLRYDAYAGFPHYFWSYPSKFLKTDSDAFHQRMFGAVDWLHH